MYTWMYFTCMCPSNVPLLFCNSFSVSWLPCLCFSVRVIVSGLAPSTQHRLRVCAVGLADITGPFAEVGVSTADALDHAPTGLTVVVLGRHELHISWGPPLAPLGRLFNYELRMNNNVAYLGTERVHTARRLAANTAYTCTVTAITSRGRCESQPVTKRTSRDEYQHTQR